MAKKSLQQGQAAELQAQKLLQSKGYTFLTRNFHSKYGEVDLIFQDQGQLVFVEVKQRNFDSLIDPLEAITPSKLQKIELTALYFMQKYPKFPQSGRVDAVSIITSEDATSQCEHLTNISQF